MRIVGEAEFKDVINREKSRGEKEEQRQLLWAIHQSLLPPEMRDEVYLEDDESVIQPPLMSQFKDVIKRGNNFRIINKCSERIKCTH